MSDKHIKAFLVRDYAQDRQGIFEDLEDAMAVASSWVGSLCPVEVYQLLAVVEVEAIVTKVTSAGDE